MRLLVLAVFLTIHLAPRTWHAPPWWLRQALCIHSYEGAWNANTGNGFFGGMQFTLTTWDAMGGVGRPDLATPREQLYRSFLLWKIHGWSRDWPRSSQLCGLR